jgi:hypothetical protein
MSVGMYHYVLIVQLLLGIVLLAVCMAVDVC